LGALALDRQGEDLAYHPEEREGVLVPGLVVLDRVEANRADEPPRVRQRDAQDRFDALPLELLSLQPSLAGEIADARHVDGVERRQVLQEPLAPLARHLPAGVEQRRDAVITPLMRVEDGFAVLREQKDRAPIRAEDLSELGEALRDGPIDLLEADIDEGSRD